MKKIFIVFILAILASYNCANQTAALAHGSGTSLEKQIGNYLIDVGYNEEIAIAGEPIRFDFNLYEGEEKDYVDFDNVWVRIGNDNATIFAGGIYKTDLGITGFTSIFPKEGKYELTVSFNKGDTEIVESSFPIEVFPSEDEVKAYPAYLIALSGIISLMAGGMIGFALNRNIKKQ